MPSGTTSPPPSRTEDMRVESEAEAQMLTQALRERRIRPENVKRAEDALLVFHDQQRIDKAKREREGRLGPGLSKLVRGPAEGIAGMVTGPVDLAAGVLRELGVPVGKPNLQKNFMKELDRGTTRPTSAGGKFLEDAEAMATGAALGPRTPRMGKIRPNVRQFARENPGVTMTPGARRGGTANWLEQQAAKFHPSVKAARGRMVSQWNTADLNHTLSTIGAPPLPPGVTGRAALRYVHAQISAGYKRLLDNMKLDPDAGQVPLRSRMQQIKQAYAGMDAAQQKNLDDIINEIVVRQPSPAVAAHMTAAAGRTGVPPTIPTMRSIKEIDRMLRTESTRATRRNTYQDDKLVEALKDIRAAVDQVGQDQNGAAWGEYRAHDRAWADWANDVRATQGAKSGWLYTPAGKRKALTMSDTSRDKRATKLGTGQAMPRVDRAEEIMGNTEPDSGTPAALGLIELLRHATNPKAAALGVAGGALYNDPVLKVLQERALGGAPKLASGPGALFGASQAVQPGDPDQNPALKQFGVQP
jgi:hypothetical protein